MSATSNNWLESDIPENSFTSMGSFKGNKRENSHGFFLINIGNFFPFLIHPIQHPITSLPPLNFMLPTPIFVIFVLFFWNSIAHWSCITRINIVLQNLLHTLTSELTFFCLSDFCLSDYTCCVYTFFIRIFFKENEPQKPQNRKNNLIKSPVSNARAAISKNVS